LAYTRRANDTFEGDHANYELTALPTFYDTPKAAEKRTYTYWVVIKTLISRLETNAIFEISSIYMLSNS